MAAPAWGSAPPWATGLPGRLHDFVKTVLLRQLVSPGATVCDLLCGRGTDTAKWAAAEIGSYVGLDLSSSALQDAEEEWKTVGKPYPASFCQLDPFLGDLESKLEGKGVPFDVVCCLGHVQDCFSSEEKVIQLLENVSSLVRPGGFFFGITADSSTLWSKYQKAVEGALKAGALRYGSIPRVKAELYSITFDDDRFSLFGTRYQMRHIDDGLAPQNQLLVHFPTLIRLAKEAGLEFIEIQNLDEFFEDYRARQCFADVFSSTCSTFLDAKGKVIPQVREYLCLYTTFVFKKADTYSPGRDDSKDSMVVAAPKVFEADHRLPAAEFPLKKCQKPVDDEGKPAKQPFKKEKESSQSGHSESVKPKREPETSKQVPSEPEKPKELFVYSRAHKNRRGGAEQEPRRRRDDARKDIISHEHGELKRCRRDESQEHGDEDRRRRDSDRGWSRDDRRSTEAGSVQKDRGQQQDDSRERTQERDESRKRSASQEQDSAQKRARREETQEPDDLRNRLEDSIAQKSASKHASQEREDSRKRKDDWQSDRKYEDGQDGRRYAHKESAQEHEDKRRDDEKAPRNEQDSRSHREEHKRSEDEAASRNEDSRSHREEHKRREDEAASRNEQPRREEHKRRDDESASRKEQSHREEHKRREDEAASRNAEHKRRENEASRNEQDSRSASRNEQDNRSQEHKRKDDEAVSRNEQDSRSHREEHKRREDEKVQDSRSHREEPKRRNDDRGIRSQSEEDKRRDDEQAPRSASHEQDNRSHSDAAQEHKRREDGKAQNEEGQDSRKRSSEQHDRGSYDSKKNADESDASRKEESAKQEERPGRSSDDGKKDQDAEDLSRRSQDHAKKELEKKQELEELSRRSAEYAKRQDELAQKSLADAAGQQSHYSLVQEDESMDVVMEPVEEFVPQDAYQQQQQPQIAEYKRRQQQTWSDNRVYVRNNSSPSVVGGWPYYPVAYGNRTPTSEEIRAEMEAAQRKLNVPSILGPGPSPLMIHAYRRNDSRNYSKERTFQRNATNPRGSGR